MPAGHPSDARRGGGQARTVRYMPAPAAPAAPAYTPAAHALARAVARSWLQRSGPGSAPRLAVAAALTVLLTLVWWPALLAAVTSVVAFGLSVRAERLLCVRLLPYTAGMITLFGIDRARRLLVVAASRGVDPEPVAGLLSGLRSTLSAAAVADCSAGHPAGCRHHPVERRLLTQVPEELAYAVGELTPVAAAS